jgi:hypothetical protein
MINISKAIEIIESSKRSHQTWLNWYSINPQGEIDYGDIAGNTQHHEICIENYTKVIELLKSYEDNNPSSK